MIYNNVGGFMEKYKNEEYLKSSIMDYSRHLFVYGKNNDHRSEFLKSIENDYPLESSSSKPCAIYLDNFGMPKTEDDLKSKNSFLIHSMCSEFFAFSVASRILEKACIFDTAELNERLKKIILLTDRFKNGGHPDIKTYEDLLRELTAARNFYYKSYMDYVSGVTNSVAIDQISVPFLELDSFVRMFKDAFGMDSYFDLLLDYKSPMATPSVKVVNNYLGARCNKDISVSVAIEPGEWPSYYNETNQLVEYVHDYSNVQLDGSYDEYLNKVRR